MTALRTIGSTGRRTEVLRGAAVLWLPRIRQSRSLSTGRRQSTAKPRGSTNRTFRANMHVTRPLRMQASAQSDDGTAQIHLTPLEDAVCQLIDDACGWIERVHPQPDAVEADGFRIAYGQGWTIEARIAGGWVRDKLLAQASHDFDISLSSLTGHIFALLLRQYLLSDDFASSRLARDNSSPFHYDSAASKELVGHITKIAANPEQSKNLETATAKLAGLQLDFVNLRKEAYIGTSRIPVMQFGTALEDAERRDITINALFYNVHTRTVEDLTGMGLRDMDRGVVRTPLDPHRTFLDDPLRVLRCVRFASRFGYRVDQDIISCLTGVDGAAIRQALMSKVSRERFGIEINKTLLGPDPSRAVELIEQMGLLDIVFGPPPGTIVRNAPPTLDSIVIWRAIALLECIWQEQHGSNVLDELAGVRLLAVDQVRAFLFYSAVLLPLRNAEWQEKKDKWVWAGECVVAEGLKQGGTTREVLAMLRYSASLFHRPMPDAFDWRSEESFRGRQLPFLNTLHPYPVSARATRAMLLRTTLIRRPELGVSADALLGANLLWAMVADLATDDSLWTQNNTEEVQQQARIDAGKVLTSSSAQIHANFFDQLKAEAALDRVKERPLLNGKEVMSAIEIPPGKLVSLVLGCVEAWQLDRERSELASPDTVQQCIAWLRDQWQSGGLVPQERRAELGGTKKKGR